MQEQPPMWLDEKKMELAFGLRRYGLHPPIGPQLGVPDTDLEAPVEMLLGRGNSSMELRIVLDSTDHFT